MAKIRCAVVGIGNCFSGLVQGIEYYRQNPGTDITGVMHPVVGGHSIHDLEFVCGFDVGENKIGKPINEAIYESPNMVNWIPKDKMPKSQGRVHETPALDGVGIWVENKIKPIESNKSVEELKKGILQILKETKAEVLVSYLPVGSEKATKFWAQVCLDARVAFVNCMPSFIASDPEWAKKFVKENIPIIGDDIKGQVGATIVHRTLAKLCDDRAKRRIPVHPPGRQHHRGGQPAILPGPRLYCGLGRTLHQGHPLHAGSVHGGCDETLHGAKGR